MMTHAYNDLYLNDAMISLAHAFDYAIIDLKINPNEFGLMFSNSSLCNEVEVGNPYVISGMSGVELATRIVEEVYPNKEFVKPTFRIERSPYYWAGWSLAYYQWYTSKRFKEIIKRVSLEDIISMYHLYHEMDIMQFIEEMDRRYDDIKFESKLKTLRTERGLSQSILAKNSGVGIRSIQLYEEGINNIDKAQAHTLYKISRALGCKIEDLLESPEKAF